MRMSSFALVWIAAIAMAAALGPCGGCRTLSALVTPEGEADYVTATDCPEAYP